MPQVAQPKETIEALEAIFDFQAAIKAARADDGKITLSDSPKFFGAALKLPAAIGGGEKIPSELKNYEGRIQVIDHFRVKFDLPDDVLEEKIERVLQSGNQFGSDVADLVVYLK